jgi:hypothetical protein
MLMPDMDIQVSLETFGKDLRYAVRGLLRNSGFTLVAVLTLALGIGANTAIFTVVNTFLIRPLPYPEPDRLVSLFERNVVGDEQQMSVAPGNFLDWQKAATSFESMSATGIRIITLMSDNAGTVPERVGFCACSATLFQTLEVKPRMGRIFTSEEDRFGAPRVVVISYALWQRRLGGAADVVGKSIRLDGEDHQVIGVMPRDFLYPHRIVEVWRPLLAGLPPPQQIRHDLHNLSVVARLRPGVSVEQAFRSSTWPDSGRARTALPDHWSRRRRPGLLGCATLADSIPAVARRRERRRHSPAAHRSRSKVGHPASAE